MLRPTTRHYGYGSRTDQLPEVHFQCPAMLSRVFNALQQLGLMTHNKIAALADFTSPRVVLQNQLCPRQQKRKLGRMFLGNQLLQPPIEVLRDAKIHRHPLRYKNGTDTSAVCTGLIRVPSSRCGPPTHKVHWLSLPVRQSPKSEESCQHYGTQVTGVRAGRSSGEGDAHLTASHAPRVQAVSSKASFQGHTAIQPAGPSFRLRGSRLCRP